MSGRYDLLVIGAGPGGYVGAIRAAQAGLRVGVVESAEIGGVCLNRGCIPTKAALKEAENLKIAIKEAGGSFSPTPVELWQRIVNSVEPPLRILRNGIENLFKAHNISFIKGEALFDGNKLIVNTKDGTHIPEFHNLIIATGSRPSLISGINIDHKRFITSDDVFALQNPPERVAILGAGAVGCEFATLFSTFAKEVHLIEIMPHVLPFLDDELSTLVERELKKSRVTVHTGTKITEIKEGEDIKTWLENGKSIAVDLFLISAGRRPNTDFLRGSDIEVRDNGKVRVDSSMRTNRSGVYAIGDCAGEMMLAHTASEEGIVAVDNIIGKARKMDYSSVPVTVFTSIEVASVGLTEKRAITEKIKVKSSSILYRSIGRPQADYAIPGLIKIIVREDGVVVGGEIAGKNATEIIHTIALAIKLGITYQELKDTVFAHPTYSELIREVADSIDGMAIHTPDK